jgi:uncharacterized protein YxeA
MKKALFLLFCLIAMSCSTYHHGLINNKKPYSHRKSYYVKNLKSNKPLFQKYKKGTTSIWKKQQNEWQYSRGKSATHRKAMNSAGGYSD